MEVLIFSNEGEFQTNITVQYFINHGISFKRFNYIEDFCNSIYLSKNKPLISNSSKAWFRRRPEFKLETDIIKSNTEVNSYLRAEQLAAYYSFCENIKIENRLGSHYSDQFIKNRNLQIAKKIGFKIPPTLITNSKSELMKFINKEKHVIIKSINNPKFIYTEKSVKVLYTKELTTENLMLIKERFYPALFQKKVNKKMDLRIIMVGKRIFCAGIMSQSNPKTEIDFRNYDSLNPNRIIPFCLNEDIKKKILLFGKATNTNFLCLDMIIDNSDKFYFLENNPNGQFDWIERACNFKINESIIEYFEK